MQVLHWCGTSCTAQPVAQDCGGWLQTTGTQVPVQFPGPVQLGRAQDSCSSQSASERQLPDALAVAHEPATISELPSGCPQYSVVKLQ
jgi:hypothetical protein